MICPKCGSGAEGNFCSSCGERLDASGNKFYEDSDGFEILEPEDYIDQTAQFSQPSQNSKAARPPKPAKAPKEKRARKAAESGAAKKKGAGGTGFFSGRKADDDGAVRESRKERKEKAEERELAHSRFMDRHLRDEWENSEREETNFDRNRINFHRKGGSSDRERENMNMREREMAGFGDSARTALRTVQTTAAKGAVTTVVLAARVMQLISCLLMAGMTAIMAWEFTARGRGMGDISRMISDRNYGMALYVGAAGAALFMGAVWTLWILSRKAAGGNVRLKTYDTGRGFIPFILCLAAVIASGPARLLIPGEPDAWRGLAAGAAAAADAVYAKHSILFFSSAAGVLLSFIRKLLRV